MKTPPFARRRPTEIYNDVVDEFQRTPEGEQRSTGFSRVSIIIGSAVNASFPLPDKGFENFVIIFSLEVLESEFCRRKAENNANIVPKLR